MAHERQAHPISLSPVERLVTILAGTWVVITPWFLGGQTWWAQALGLVVGVIALAAAVSVRENRPVLIRFPIFWLGLFFLGYVACQSFNPWLAATPVQPGAYVWSLAFPPHVAWLPAGVRADYGEDNTWREWVNWAGPWMLGCAWWAAVRRRRAAAWLWRLAFLNGVAIALVSLGYIYFPTKKILWFYVEPGQEIWLNIGWAHHIYIGAFTYTNAAAGFLYLCLAAGLALTFHARERARAVGRDSGLSWVILVGCGVVMAGIVISGSRGGLLFGGFLLVASVIRMAWETLREQGWSLLHFLPGLGLLAAVILAAGSLLISVKPVSVERLGQNLLDSNGRLDLWKSTVLMIKDRPWLGFGGGSYRYVSPFYFRKLGLFPDPDTLGGLQYRANHAHSDGLQFTMEYGVLGAGILLLMLLYWVGRVGGLARWLGAKGWMVVLGLGATVVHSLVDFPFYNEAVLTLFTLLLISVVKMAELNRSMEEGR